MAKSEEKEIEEIVETELIIAEIEAYIDGNGGIYSNWYVGITNDLEKRLFGDHNVDKKKGNWYSKKASTIDIARSVEEYFFDEHETQGDTGGGNNDSVYIYAYEVTDKTVE